MHSRSRRQSRTLRKSRDCEALGRVGDSYRSVSGGQRWLSLPQPLLQLWGLGAFSRVIERHDLLTWGLRELKDAHGSRNWGNSGKRG